MYKKFEYFKCLCRNNFSFKCFQILASEKNVMDFQRALRYLMTALCVNVVTVAWSWKKHISVALMDVPTTIHVEMV